jgi:hypothetical protein
MSRNRAPRILIAALAAVLSLLLLAVGALAAQPMPGKSYAGFVGVQPYRGFKAKVSFKVSSDGKHLLAFNWQAGGCIGMGGPGNAYADPYNNYRAATIPVSATGTFSVANAKWTSGYHSPAKTTIFTVTGRFTTAKTATGIIHYTQTDASGAGPCSGHATFTAETS